MPTPNPKDQKAIDKLGHNVRKFRNLKGLTMMQLAIRCNVEYTTISKVERGLVNTSISMIAIIAAALEIHASRLLED